VNLQSNIGSPFKYLFKLVYSQFLCSAVFEMNHKIVFYWAFCVLLWICDTV